MAELSAEAYRDIAATLADVVKHNRDLFAAFSVAAAEAAQNVTSVLEMLDQAIGDVQAADDPTD
jgi:hypothetical protein